MHVNTDFFKFLFLQSFTRTTAKQFVWCTMPVTWHASRRGLNHKVSQSHSAIVMQLPSLLGSLHAPSSGIASCLTRQLGPFIPLSSGYEWISACLMKLATKPSLEEKGMNEKQIQEQTLDSRRQLTKKLRGESIMSSKSRDHYQKTPSRAPRTAPLLLGGIREGRSCCPAALVETASAEFLRSPSLLFSSLRHRQSALAKAKVNKKIPLTRFPKHFKSWVLRSTSVFPS